MSIRLKLLLLVLTISVIPLAILRFRGGRAQEQLGREMIGLNRRILIDTARDQLMTTVQDQARLLDQGARLLAMDLAGQAERAAHLLQHGVPPEAKKSATTGLAEDCDDLATWRITALEDGKMWESPSATPPPACFDPHHAKWYRDAVAAGRLVWTIPSLEPDSHQVVITASMPVRDTNGRTVGVTAVMTPFSRLLANSFRAQGLTPGIKAFLVSLDGPKGHARGLSLIGQYEAALPGAPPEEQKFDWCCAQGQRQVIADDPQLAQAILQDLRQHKSFFRQAFYQGHDALWAYAPTSHWGAALLIITPIDQVVKEADLAGKGIETRFAHQADISLRLVLAAMAFIATVAFLAVGQVTRPIRALALATERIAQGDLDTKVTPEGGNELASLGRTFNNMVPHLREHSRMREALALAEELQKNLLPASLPRFAGLEIAAQTRFCDEIGGDFYDIVKDAHGRPGCLGVLLGDVSGHGLDAALLMATARALLRQRAHQNGSPAEVVTEVNGFLTLDTDGTGRFMTLFYMEFDHAAGALTWVRAGHDPAMLFDPERGSFTELAGPGIPLGVVKNHVFLQETRGSLSPGQVLLIASDGLWEARNTFGEMFGKNRVKDVIIAHAQSSAQTILDALIEQQTAFMEGGKYEDDVTLIVVKVGDDQCLRKFCWYNHDIDD